MNREASNRQEQNQLLNKGQRNTSDKRYEDLYQEGPAILSRDQSYEHYQLQIIQAVDDIQRVYQKNCSCPMCKEEASVSCQKNRQQLRVIAPNNQDFPLIIKKVNRTNQIKFVKGFISKSISSLKKQYSKRRSRFLNNNLHTLNYILKLIYKNQEARHELIGHLDPLKVQNYVQNCRVGKQIKVQYIRTLTHLKRKIESRQFISKGQQRVVDQQRMIV